LSARGFTIIELIVVIALFVILVSVIPMIFLTGLKSWSSGRNRAQIREEANLAMEMMVRDLGQADTITVATASAITFAADVDNDNANETVAYSRDAGNNLIRAVAGTAIALNSDTQALTFTYTDLNNAVFTPTTQADRDNIRVVTIGLRLSNVSENITVASSAYTRNQ
jgi:prepilin-type N-terminal cleavage/methylation domain-containing protein